MLDIINANSCNQIFQSCIKDYHVVDQVDQAFENPFTADQFESLLYRKCWIDTVQWHLEDLIRDPAIAASDALALKRRIDKSNQDRTDLVEQIDDWFLLQCAKVKYAKDARLNTESPAWALDRLSILALKIYHMQEEVSRKDSTPDHQQTCQHKLAVLKIQQKDLILAIDQLIEDVSAGRRIMKVYRQMKMYNDPKLNPVLYGKK